MKTPKWFLKRNALSVFLYPFSGFYYIASKMVFNIRKYKEYSSNRPIICFGNILSGGVGKTPIVRQVAKFFDVPVVMRGYKKSVQTGNIGDEAKMLSNDGILVHVGDRKSNLILLNKQESKTPIIMDDGFQNSSIKKDISVLVFDESIGFGNGFLLPAGPLREPVSAISRADAIIVIKRKNVVKNFNLPTNIPIFNAYNQEICPYGKNESVVVFAGIGYPDKFFNAVPANVVEKISFPDHYQYTDNDIKNLIKIADEKNAKLLTTEKDWVRLPDWAKHQVRFSQLKTEIENGFYDWIKGKVDEIGYKKN
ncbi:MAG: tetraacyldisaccharide 4'-kinase [Alphaproteobacteria bacterium]|nr:tetraacyldisaccharide 4'-kinase [Alphaproteobacteria bacterium]